MSTPNGVVLYRGPSMLDGAPIIVIATGLAKGSGVPNKDKVGKVTKAQLDEIVRLKGNDLNARDGDHARRMIEGTARSMGITVEG